MPKNFEKLIGSLNRNIQAHYDEIVRNEKLFRIYKTVTTEFLHNFYRTSGKSEFELESNFKLDILDNEVLTIPKDYTLIINHGANVNIFGKLDNMGCIVNEGIIRVDDNKGEFNGGIYIDLSGNNKNQIYKLTTMSTIPEISGFAHIDSLDDFKINISYYDNNISSYDKTFDRGSKSGYINFSANNSCYWKLTIPQVSELKTPGKYIVTTLVKSNHIKYKNIDSQNFIMSKGIRLINDNYQIISQSYIKVSSINPHIDNVLSSISVPVNHNAQPYDITRNDIKLFINNDETNKDAIIDFKVSGVNLGYKEFYYDINNNKIGKKKDIITFTLSNNDNELKIKYINSNPNNQDKVILKRTDKNINTIEQFRLIKNELNELQKNQTIYWIEEFLFNLENVFISSDFTFDINIINSLYPSDINKNEQSIIENIIRRMIDSNKAEFRVIIKQDYFKHIEHGHIKL